MTETAERQRENRFVAGSQHPAPDAAARRLTIGLAVLGVFVTYVPITGVSVALTTIARDTGASTSSLQWVTDAYVIPMAAAVLSGGLFGDRYGRRLVFLTGMAFTVVGSLLAAISAAAGAAALPLLWAGQAVSGVGAGLLLPTTLALIAHVVPDPQERGRYIGLWATGLLVGLSLGPIVSGSLVASAPYGWIFVPTIVLALIAAIAAALRLPESRSPHPRHLDVPGQLTATLAIAGLIFGVIEGGARGWLDPLALVGLGVGAATMVAFIVLERRAASPLLDLGLFRSLAFTSAGFAALVALFSVVGITFLISLFLGMVKQLPPLEIGLQLLCVSGVAAVLNPLVSRLMRRIRVGWLLAIGLALAAAGVLSLLGLDADISPLDLSWRLGIFGLALAIILTTVSVAAVNAVPWHHAGMAAAANTALRQFGGALGPAVLGAVFVSRLSAGADAVAALHTAFLVDGALLAAAAIAGVAAALRQKD